MTAVALLACAGAASPAGAATTGHGRDAGVTFWRAIAATCPAKPSATARPGSVVAGTHEDCVRLERRVMTLQRPTAAVAEPQQGGNDWQVEVTFTRSQQREFGRITAAAVGHQLAIVDREGLISAPTVQEPIRSRHLEIVGLTKSHAQRLARTLSR